MTATTVDERLGSGPERLPEGLPKELRSTLPWLVADIGGTNARFGWVADESGQVSRVRTLEVAEHDSPAAAAKAYLQSLPDGAAAAPRYATFAVATPVSDGEMSFTNSPWRFSTRQLQADLGLQDLQVLNDFEALAWSLPRLQAHQLKAHGPLPSCRGPLAVVGPGTGLGVAGLVPGEGGWQSVASEGGHASLAAADEFEHELLAWVRSKQGHVSAETLLSGTGLPLLHEAVMAVHGDRMAQASLSAAEIGQRALDGSDASARLTVDTFCALLGGFAGDVALMLGARGGLFIGGGVVPRWGGLFFESRFRERFEAKGGHSHYVRAIPTVVITDTLVALTGAAAALEKHLSRSLPQR